MDATPQQPRIRSDTPTVAAEHLRTSQILAYLWVADGTADAVVSSSAGSMNLEELLETIGRTCEVNAAMALALFQRALALAALCAEADLPMKLFEGGLPGVDLCRVAASASVYRPASNVAGCANYSFDQDEILLALAVRRS